MIDKIDILNRKINISKITNPKLKTIIKRSMENDSFCKSKYSDYTDNCYQDGGFG